MMTFCCECKGLSWPPFILYDDHFLLFYTSSTPFFPLVELAIEQNLYAFSPVSIAEA